VEVVSAEAHDMERRKLKNAGVEGLAGQLEKNTVD